MAKRARGSVRPGQRRRIDRRPASPTAATTTPTPAAAPKPAGLSDAELERAAQLEADLLAEEKAAEQSRKRTRERTTTREVVGTGGSLAAQEAAEYAYVARDVKDIVKIASLLLGDPARPLDPDRRHRDHPDRRLTPPGPTIGPMPPRRAVPGARPEALFKPPPERQPLAARLRPRTLEEFVGQAHLVGERGPLRRSVSRGHLASMLLWGPPGTGKTSLARLLADAVGAEFRTVSAVMSGVAEVRATIAEAQDKLALHGGRSVLFIDEIHRFNKAQQDALLPHVEDGTVTLIGATTENPYFEVNSALLSRMRVWRLEPLTDEDVASILRTALADAERGLAGMYGPRGGVAMADEPFEHLVEVAGGDARQALNILEGAVALADDEDARDTEDRVSPTLAHVEAAAQQRVLAYDRAGRRPLRHGLRVHQEPPRQRPGRGALLAGGDGRGRRGSRGSSPGG